MSAFNPGDTVRCIKTWTTHVIDRGGEYTVEEVRPDNLTDTMEALVCGDWVPFSYFEKVEPEFVVGQQVSDDDYQRLPVGSKVKIDGDSFFSHTKIADNRWRSDIGNEWPNAQLAGFHRTLTHLPDATEPEDKDDLYVEPEPLKESPRDVYPARPVRLTDRLGAILFDGVATVEWTSTGAIGTITPKPAPVKPEEPDVLGAVVYSESNGKFWTRASIDPEESHVWAGGYDKCWFNWRQLPDDVVVWDPADPARGGAS